MQVLSLYENREECIHKNSRNRRKLHVNVGSCQTYELSTAGLWLILKFKAEVYAQYPALAVAAAQHIGKTIVVHKASITGPASKPKASQAIDSCGLKISIAQVKVVFIGA